MNELLNANSLREMQLTPGERVLDVGCGLGQLSRDMARQVGPSGIVVGIERSTEQLAVARRLVAEAGEEHLVDFRAGPAEQLPLAASEWSTFDVVHARFLLEHVPNPVAVVRQMVRALRPGGRIVLEDDPHDTLRLWPDPPGFQHL